MSEPNMVVIYKAYGELQAQIIKGRLESEGIPVLIQNEALGTFGFTVDKLGEFRILVPADREKDAVAVIESDAQAAEQQQDETEENDNLLPGAFPSPSKP